MENEKKFFKNENNVVINRYSRKRPKVDATIFDSALSHTRRSDASEKREEKSVSTFGHFASGQVSSPRMHLLNQYFLFNHFNFKTERRIW